MYHLTAPEKYRKGFWNSGCSANLPKRIYNKDLMPSLCDFNDWQTSFFEVHCYEKRKVRLILWSRTTRKNIQTLTSRFSSVKSFVVHLLKYEWNYSLEEFKILPDDYARSLLLFSKIVLEKDTNPWSTDKFA